MYSEFNIRPRYTKNRRKTIINDDVLLSNNLVTRAYRGDDQLEFEKWKVLEILYYYLTYWNDISRIDTRRFDPVLIASIDNFYYKCKNFEDRGGDGKNIFSRSLQEGHEFSKELKKYPNYCFIKQHLKDADSEIPEEIPLVDNYDDIFPFDHLPCWNYKVEDIKISLEQPVEIDKALLDTFQETFERMLPDIEFVEPNIEKFRTTRCSTGSKDTAWHFEEVIKRAPRLTTNYRVVRRVIPVGPANFRDAAILTPDSSYTINYLGKKILQMISKMKNSAMNIIFDDGWNNYRRIERKFNDVGFSFVRDFKKCGLSMPVQLIDRIRKVLIKEYPRQNFEYLDIYNNLEIYIEDLDGYEDGWYTPLRGHNLGQANELTTLIQCILFTMVRERSEDLYGLELDVDAVFWNDDSAIVGDYHDLMLYKIHDLAICDSLGLMLKSEQSAILQDGLLFMEQYTSLKGYGCTKLTRLRCAIIDKISCYNLVEAKFAIRSLSFDIIDNFEDVETELRKLIGFWGAEFYELEREESDIFGGWLLERYYYHDETFASELYNNNRSINNLRFRAMKAEKIKLSKFFLKKQRKQLNKKSKKWKLYSSDFGYITDEFEVENFNLDMFTRQPRAIFKSAYSAISMRTIPARYWKTLMERRRAEFEKDDDTFFDIDIFNFALQNFKDRNFVIPKCYISGKASNITYYSEVRPPMPGYFTSKFISNEEATLAYLSTISSNVICTSDCSLSHILAYINYNSQSLPGKGSTEDYYWTNEIDINLFNYSLNPVFTMRFYAEEYGYIPSKIWNEIQLPRLNAYSNVLGSPEDFEEYIGIDHIELYDKIRSELKSVLNLIDDPVVYDLFEDLPSIIQELTETCTISELDKVQSLEDLCDLIEKVNAVIEEEDEMKENYFDPIMKWLAQEDYLEPPHTIGPEQKNESSADEPEGMTVDWSEFQAQSIYDEFSFDSESESYSYDYSSE